MGLKIDYLLPMKSLSNESDYNAALKRIEELIATNPKEGTVAFKELNILATAVSAYEETHFPIEEPAE